MTLCVHAPSRIDLRGELDDELRLRLERAVMAGVTAALERAVAGGGGVRLGEPGARQPAEPVARHRLDRDRGIYRIPGYEDGGGEPVELPVSQEDRDFAVEAEAPRRSALRPEPQGPDRPRFEHPHLAASADEVFNAPSPFEGHTIALLTVDRAVRIGSPVYAVSGALVRALRWGALLFGAGSYAIYEGPLGAPADERRYWTLRTDEPVSRQDLLRVAEVRGQPGHFVFGATGWIAKVEDAQQRTYLLRALVTREREAIFPPSAPLLEEFWAEVRSSAPEESTVNTRLAMSFLFEPIDARVAAGDADGAAELLAQLDAQAFALVDWRKRSSYLGALVDAWTGPAEERAIVEVLKASGNRSELDASLDLLRRRGLFEKLFDDLDSELFSLLAEVGERFGHHSPLTLDELAVLMQDTNLIPRDWTSVVVGTTITSGGVTFSTNLIAEAYEAARGFVRFLGGILDAIEMVLTRPQQLIEGVAQLARLAIAVEGAKLGHRPSQLVVERTLLGIGRRVVAGLRGVEVLGVGAQVGRRVRWAVVWEVASWFIGVGEVAAVVKGAGLTERIAAIARMLGILRRLGEVVEAETLAARASRLARALRAESSLFAHEDELLHFLAHLPEEDVGKLGRLLGEADLAEGVTFAALRQAHPELAEAAGDALRKAEVLKTFAGKAGALGDEVVEATARLIRSEGVGVEEAGKIVAAIPEGEGARFAYALRAVPPEALARAADGPELLRALAASPARMEALESFGYPAYRALWARSARDAQRFDQYVTTLAELQRSAAGGGAVELRELVDGLVEGSPAAWRQLEEARTARYGASGAGPPAGPPGGGGGPPGGGPPSGGGGEGGPPAGRRRLPPVPSSGRPPVQGPPRVLQTGSESGLVQGAPDPNALASGSHYYWADSKGRALGAEGWVYPRPAGAGRAPGAGTAQDAVTKGRTGLHGAHLFADRFGGAPITQNVVAFTAEANLGSMRVVENTVASHVGSGRDVFLQAAARYLDEGDLPASVTYHIWLQEADGTLRHADQVTVEFLNDRSWIH